MVSKGSAMGSTKTITIKKNGINRNLDVRKGINESTMFYLNSNIYSPKSLSTKNLNQNMIEFKLF